jgi:hypothetical protein
MCYRTRRRSPSVSETVLQLISRPTRHPLRRRLGEKLCFVKWRPGASQSESPLPAQISAIHGVRSFCVKIGESTKQDSIRRPAPALVPHCLRFRSMPMPVPRS